MVLFPIIGLLLWIAVLFVVVVVGGVFWAAGKTLWWFLDSPDRTDHGQAKAVSPKPQATPPARQDTRDTSGIWPKWTPSHRLYKDYELALWQEQFDALNSSIR